MTLMDVLKDGGEIHYAALAGGFDLVLKGESLIKTVEPSKGYYSLMMEFLDLRHAGALICTGSMGQGHHRFHGSVFFYKIANMCDNCGKTQETGLCSTCGGICNPKS